MANIIIPKPWERIARQPTDENTYHSRRQIVKSLGIASAGLLTLPAMLGNCNNKKNNSVVVRPVDNGEARIQGDCQNCFTFPGMDQLYPPEKKNQKYTLDRPLTSEYDATHYNNFYEFIDRSDANIYNAYKFVDPFDTREWKIKVTGQVKNRGTFTLEDLIKRFGLEERTYRFRCVERWSMAVPWTGFPFSKLIKFLEPNSKATHIAFESFADEEQMPGVKNLTWYPWPYFEGLRIEEAMNELAFLATGLYGKPLPKQNGAPVRLVVPWKYGYKNIKSIVTMNFVAQEPETFWHKLQPKEYPFVSNIDPNVPHPRWSQEIERMIPDGEPRPTLKYNGYGEFVAGLYE